MENQNDKVQELLDKTASTITGGYVSMAVQELLMICKIQAEQIQRLENRADGIVGELEYQQSKIDQLFNPGKQQW